MTERAIIGGAFHSKTDPKVRILEVFLNAIAIHVEAPNVELRPDVSSFSANAKPFQGLYIVLRHTLPICVDATKFPIVALRDKLLQSAAVNGGLGNRTSLYLILRRLP